MLLTGKKVKYGDIFGRENQEELKDAGSFSLKDEIETNRSAWEENLEDFEIEILESAKGVYDAVLLGKMLKGNAYISQAKVAQFKENKKDLDILKKYVNEHCREKYKYIFREKHNKDDTVKYYLIKPNLTALKRAFMIINLAEEGLSSCLPLPKSNFQKWTL